MKKTVLFLILIAGLLIPSVAAYSGTSNVTDASVNDARVDPSASVTWTVGPIYNDTSANPVQNGWGLDFDGVNDNVNCGSDASLDNLIEYTFQAWVRRDTDPGEVYGRLLHKGGAGVGNLFSIYISDADNKVYSKRTYTGNDASSGSTSAIPEAWTLVTVTLDSTNTTRIYFNTSDVTSITSTGTGNQDSDAGNNLILAGNDDTDRSYGGILDESILYNRTIGVGEISYTFNNKVPLNQTGLVLWVDFDSNVQDQSGNGNNGAIVGNPVYVRGIRGKAALVFDEAGDYVSVTDDISLDIISDLSIDLWMASPLGFGAPASRAILSKTDISTNVGGYALSIRDTGDIDFWVATGAANDGINWPNAVTADILTHLALIYNSGNNSANLYVNNIPQGSNALTNGITANAFDLLIAADDDGGGPDRYFNGTLDEVRLYNRTLIESEVLEHFQGNYSNDTGLVLLLDMDGNVLDTSGEGNNGAENGDPEYSDGWANVPVSTSYNGTSGTTVELVNCTTGMCIIPDTAPATHGNYTVTASVPAASANATYVGFIADLYNIDVRTVYDEIESGLYTLLVANGSSVIDGHPLTNGDSLTIDGVTFTYNSYTGDLEGSVRKNTPQTVTFDTVDSLNEATYGITNGNISTPAIVTWTTGSLDLIKPFFQTGDITGGILGVATQSMGALIFYSVFMLGLSVALYQYIGPLPTILAWMMGWGVFGGVVHGNARLLAWGLMSLGGGLLLVKIWYNRRTM